LIDESHIDAVIFDMDGVLADTEGFHIEGWIGLAEAHGLATDDSLLALARETFGQTNDTIIPLLWKHAGRELLGGVESLSREKEAYYRKAARGRVVPMPGVDRFLRWLDAQGIPTAIGTSGPVENVRFIVREFGWDGLFTELVDRSRFAGGKPAPDCFLAASRLIGIRPRHGIVFEDSVHGLNGARQGGFHAAAIASTHEPDELWSLARWVFRDFREIFC